VSGVDQNLLTDAALAELREERVLERIWDRDPSVWTDDPAEQAICRDRLGWLDVNATLRDRLPAVQAFAEQVRDDGIRHVVLCGMGGSSLAPEVFSSVLGSADGFPELIVLDTTDPLRLRAAEERINYATTLFVIASKSGGTLETDCLRRFFTGRLTEHGLAPAGERLVAITDPGSPLCERAATEGYRAVFENPADIGGRFSALSLFGLVPAALIGVNVIGIMDAAAREAQQCTESGAPGTPASPALRMGAAFGGLARAGLDKLTFLCAPSTLSLATWAEQLVAESTGKNGRGVVPVIDERTPIRDGGDRQYVQVAPQGEPCPPVPEGIPAIPCLLSYPGELGALFFRLEMATALAAALLHVEPFDQPDVASAKAAAAEVLATGGRVGDTVATGDGFELQLDETTRAALGVANVADGASAADVLRAFAALPAARTHTGLLSYVPNAPAFAAPLAEVRAALGALTLGATTSSIGPRYLHSSGQLHKGGPAGAAFVLFDGEPAGDQDLAIPDRDLTFDRVFRAQAEGDARALLSRGRSLLRVRLGADPAQGLTSLATVLKDLAAS